MIFVTVGTHEDPFDRLVEAADRLAAAAPDEEVVLQKGPSRVPTPHCTTHDFLPPSRMGELVREARVVVTHGGPASILLAQWAGHRPIVVPRRAGFGEHVDDHQLHFTRRIADRIQLLEDPTRLAEALESQADGRGERLEPNGHEMSEQFSRRLDALLGEIVRERRSSLRSTIAAWMRGLRG